MSLMHSESSVDLKNLSSLTSLLDRLPQGSPARNLAEKMGLWSKATHDNVASRRKVFPTQFSALNDDDVSDTNAYWLSEVFRATELCGLLEGQKLLLSLEVKTTRARTRSSIRRRLDQAARDLREKEVAEIRAGDRLAKDLTPMKAPAVTTLNDMVEEEEDVLAVEAMLHLLLTVLESAKAYKEACLTVAQGVSREISFRQAQLGARLR